LSAIAYHITWTAYGTWLPGDDRGWVAAGKQGIQDADADRRVDAMALMAGDPVILTPRQREIVADTIRAHCHFRGWEIHAVNVRSNHVHVVVSADRHPDEVMRQFKAWTSRRLSEDAGLAASPGERNGRKRWWTEQGSTKWVFDDRYLREAIDYVDERQ
jgi:REP element-mobilizing transposase RayT